MFRYESAALGNGRPAGRPARVCALKGATTANSIRFQKIYSSLHRFSTSGFGSLWRLLVLIHFFNRLLYVCVGQRKIDQMTVCQYILIVVMC
jgi:hypothetical protein